MYFRCLMNALRLASPRTRRALLSLAVCLAFVVFAAIAGSSSAAAQATSTINICIAKAGPEKGTVRFVSTQRCRRGEAFVQVFTASASEGVMGVQEEGAQGDEAAEAGFSGEDPIADSFLVAGMTTGDAPRSGTSYLGPFIGLAPTPTELSAQQPMPFAGEISNFGFKIDVPPGAGSSYTMTVRKNGAAGGSAIACKIEGAGSGNTSCLDTAHSLSFAAGDLLSVQVVPKGSPVRWGGARWSATLTP